MLGSSSQNNMSSYQPVTVPSYTESGNNNINNSAGVPDMDDFLSSFNKPKFTGSAGAQSAAAVPAIPSSSSSSSFSSGNGMGMGIGMGAISIEEQIRQTQQKIALLNGVGNSQQSPQLPLSYGASPLAPMAGMTPAALMGMPNNMSSNMSNNMPNNMPNNMSNNMPNNMSNNMPNNMPNNMGYNNNQSQAGMGMGAMGGMQYQQPMAQVAQQYMPYNQQQQQPFQQQQQNGRVGNISQGYQPPVLMNNNNNNKPPSNDPFDFLN